MSQETLGEGEGGDAAWVRGYHAEQVDGGGDEGTFHNAQTDHKMSSPSFSEGKEKGGCLGTVGSATALRTLTPKHFSPRPDQAHQQHQRADHPVRHHLAHTHILYHTT